MHLYEYLFISGRRNGIEKDVCSRETENDLHDSQAQEQAE
jgi:hypothetical protein